MNDDLIATLGDWRAHPDGGATLEIPTGWMQGRSVFGGVTAACMSTLAARVAPDGAGPLRLMSTQLLAPVVPGPIHGDAEVLRQGRNIAFISARLRQSDRIVARATVVRAKPLSDQLDLAGPAKPDVPAPDMLRSLPQVPGITPEFTQHVDLRWAEGGLPFSGAEQAAFVGHFRYRIPLQGMPAMLVLLDTLPGPSTARATHPVPASTVSWTAHVLTVPQSFEQWFTLAYETVCAKHGLHTIVGRLYSEQGTLLGWTEQLSAVFA